MKINKKKGNNMTYEQVEKWIQTSKKGEKTMYYKGFLSKESDGEFQIKRMVKLINDFATTKAEDGKYKRPIIDVVHKKISGIRSDPNKTYLPHPDDAKNEIVYEYYLQKR